MPVPSMPMAEAGVVDHQKRFQAAVDVIHNLPKNGSYSPSYDVMLRFYSLYKQAVCGPCKVSRPGFWDPVGRYKWDAWSRLGEMSSESAMAAYVDEMKQVAQQVIDNMPMDEKTASFFHHFEPLYVVINDMPRPPQALLALREGTENNDQPPIPAEIHDEEEEEEDGNETEDQPTLGEAVPEQEASQSVDLTSNILPQDSAVSEGLVLTSDSESEVFCDSVDSVEQLDSVKVRAPKSNGFHNGHMDAEPTVVQTNPRETVPEATQLGAGQGGEGAGDEKGPPIRRGRDPGRGGLPQGWRERGAPQGGPRRAGMEAPGSGAGGGRGGGDGSEGGAEARQESQVQQQIVLALRRLREDMRSVMDRLEVVENLTAAHARASDWRPCMQCAASPIEPQEEKWWPFEVSGQTILLLLLWPFAAQGLVHLMKRGRRASRIPL
ncbi:acyl-CoA-binding domain-containing protein 4 [Aplochiton taeniatus]